MGQANKPRAFIFLIGCMVFMALLVAACWLLDAAPVLLSGLFGPVLLAALAYRRWVYITLIGLVAGVALPVFMLLASAPDDVVILLLLLIGVGALAEIIHTLQVALIKAGQEQRTLAIAHAENPNPVLRVNSEGYVQFGNPAAHALVAAGRRSAAARVPDSWLPVLRRVLNTRGPAMLEYDVGSQVYALTFTSAASGPDSVNIYGMDISTRRRAEMDAYERRRLMHLVLSNLPNLLLVVDEDEIVTSFFAPPELSRFLASGSIDANRPLREMLPAEFWGTIIHQFDEVRAEGQPRELVRAFRFKDETVWLQVRILPFADSNDLLIAASDITEFKRIEQELQVQHDFATRIMLNMGQGLTVLDEQWRFVFVNPAFAHMLGRVPDELLGLSFVDISNPADHIKLQNAQLNRMQGENCMCEVRLLHADGREVYALITGVHLQREGKETGAIAVVTDLTERKHMEEAVAAARDQALEGSRLKSEFLAMMSHEIRTPMNGIIGVAQILLESNLDEEQREFAAIIAHEAYALLDILNDILDFSKIEAGHLVLESEALNLHDVLEKIIESQQTAAGGKGLVLDAAVSPEVPPLVLGDTGRLRQVLLNLIGNAIKFTPQGKVSVEITPVYREADHIMLQFAVRDTGIGIPPEVQNRLFEPFVQGNDSVTRKYGGTGLGLAITRRLVELMGGKVHVDSVPGQGSNFSFTAHFLLPNPESVTALSSASTSGVLEHPVLPPGKTILLVEDNLVNQDVALMQLRLLGYDAEAVGDGRTAVEVYSANPERFALILMDIQLPRMDGLAASEAIRSAEASNGHRVPIIAVTANAMSGDRERCLHAGMDDYIAKPVRMEVLQDVLARWLAAPVE